MALNPVNLIDKYISTSYDKVKIVADNLTEIIRVADLVNHQASTTVPTTRSDGTALVAGDTYFDESSNVTYTWNTVTGTWVNSVSVNIVKETITITAGIRSTGVVNLTSPYTLGVNQIDVYIQGLYIDPAVYTETDQTTITFAVDTLVISQEIDIVIASNTTAAVIPATAVTYETPRGFATNLHTVLDDSRVQTFATLLLATNAIAGISIGDTIFCEEREAGDNTPITLDAVDETTVSENGIEIIAGDVVVSLALRLGNPINCAELGLSSSNIGSDNTNVLNRAFILGNTLNRSVYAPGNATAYTVAPAINLQEGSNFFGDGFSTTFFVESTAIADNIFKAETKSNVRIADITINGNKAGQTLTQYNIYFGAMTDSVIEGVRSFNSKGDGIHTYDCDRVKVLNNFSYLNDFHGIEAEQCRDCTYMGNHSYTNLRHGFYCFEGEVAASGSHRVLINNNQFTDNSQYGIGVQGALSDQIMVNDNFISGNLQYGCTFFDLGTTQTDTVSRAASQFKNNHIVANGFHGFYVFATEWIQITGNIFDNNSRTLNNGYIELFLDGNALTGYTANCDISHNTFISTHATIKAQYAIKENDINTGPNQYQHNNFIGTPTVSILGIVHASSIVGDQHGTGTKLRDSGVFTGTGNGILASFVMPHGLDAEPNNVIVTPASEDAVYTTTGTVKHTWYITVDGTNITVVYPGTVPKAGTNNVVFRWFAEATETI